MVCIMVSDPFFPCMLPLVSCSLRLVPRSGFICIVAAGSSVFDVSLGLADGCGAMDLAEAIAMLFPINSALRGSGVTCSCGLDWTNAEVTVSETVEHGAWGSF